MAIWTSAEAVPIKKSLTGWPPEVRVADYGPDSRTATCLPKTDGNGEDKKGVRAIRAQ